MKQPRVTVLMAVYNGEAYLRDAIDSVINQTFKDFEFLIIDDGSTDTSLKIIQSYSDPRIKLVRNRRNMRIIYTLNRGLRLAKGDYIARMDADDIAFLDRLDKQVSFMDENPDIGISGTWTRIFANSKIISKTIAEPVSHEEIRCKLLFSNSFQHPSVIIRRAFLEKYDLRFDDKFLHVEDYELWVRASMKFRLANIPKVLLYYRYHGSQIGRRFEGEQINFGDKVRQEALRLNFSWELNEKEKSIYREICNLKLEVSDTFLDESGEFLLQILRKNAQSKIFSQNILGSTCARQWFILCKYYANKGLFSWHTYWKSPLCRYRKLPYFEAFTFFVMCLFSPIVGGNDRIILKSLARFITKLP